MFIAAAALAPDAHSMRRQGRVIAVAKTVTVPAGTSASAIARCGRRGNLVGGGFQTPLFSPVFTSASRRYGRRAWKATGTSLTKGDGTLTAYAYCRRGAPLLRQRRALTVIPGAGPVASARPVCPRWAKAVAGGFEGVLSEELSEIPIPIASHRAGRRGWRASAQLSKGSNPHLLAVYVYCTRVGRGLRRVTGSPSMSNVAPTLFTPRCRRTALSGGFSFSQITKDRAALLLASRRAGRRWLTRIAQLEGVPVTATGIAYCG